MKRLIRQIAVIARRDFLAIVATPTFLLFLLAPAFMLELPRGFSQHEALARRIEINPAPGKRASEVPKILLGIAAKEAQVKAPLPRGRAVTGARVAARFAQDWNDLRAEVPLRSGRNRDAAKKSPTRQAGHEQK